MNAIHLQDGHAFITEDCRGCGNCVAVCPTGAIELTIEDETFIEQTIERLSALVDLS